MRDLLTAFLTLSALMVVGCSDEQVDPSETPPPNTHDLVTTPYDLEAGQERYLCYTFRSPPEKKAIVRVEPIQGQTVHHIALFRTMTPEQEGVFECPQLISLNWEPIWAGGAGAKALDVPEDVGFVIEPNTQYLSQYHLLNATPEPINTAATIRLTYAEDVENITPAGIFALGAFSLSIPAQAKGFAQTTKCNPSHDLNVFAIFPHMHKLGRSIRLAAGKTEMDAIDAYRKDPWVFGEQPMAPLELGVKAGDYLQSTCTWDNPTAKDVNFGESSDDEMCFTVLFYHPFTGLDGCIDP